MDIPEQTPEQDRFKTLLIREMRGICELSPEQVAMLWSHYRTLCRWRTKVNLMSDRRVAEIVKKHYCESLFLAAQLPPVPLSVADVGSGAGFPGVPVAVLRPDCQITLIEARSRKTVFLKEACRHLPNVTVAHCRAEDLGQRFDWLIARAVSWPEISRLAAKLSDRLALIVSGKTTKELSGSALVRWDSVIPIPWRKESFVIMGEARGRDWEVSRGTEAGGAVP
ncbi:MAG TPA: 16S rRNA (guanine(527)-N(7))-methyltransferase RsmG [Bryobacteraceae bacterium]|nr:16S rRNA (guanine(527)-N(7))-methyltransferase RsmG [Bryobacteraceae bacterium]